jgi:carbamoyltransferase
MVGSEIVAAAQEERFTGLKGDYGYPKHAIAYCLKQAGIRPSEIDEVALASQLWNPVLTKIKRNANFSVDDWVKEQHDFWKPTLFEKKQVSLYHLFKDRKGWRYDDTYPMDHLLKGYMNPEEMKEMAKIRKATVAKLLGIPEDRVRSVIHEDCHTYYAYYGSPLRGKLLAITSEGIGDYSNGTVSIMDESGRQELASTKDNHLGHIYQYITLILGMKPAQHEYKVMGLAPYANVKELEKSYKVFKNILKIEDLKILYDQRPTDLYFWFRDKLEGHRFDGIAGAVQKFVEDVLSAWFKVCCEKTGINRVVFSGGVAQNIKAAKTLSELDCIKEIYVCPAAGDTSISIGACYWAMWDYLHRQGLPIDINPLENIYLGPEYSGTDVEKAIAKSEISGKYAIKHGATNEEVATLLAAGKVVARCFGRMEFGLRALGNRSILADPRHLWIVTKINSQIKFRDFWMPFTPTVLAEREADYIVNPKGLESPYMAMAFDSTPLARKELIAAMHPADFTVRPQILERHRNPRYYDLIKTFEAKTGVGGILNTSLNLHGLPVVLGPDEAIYTFENSELDALLLEDTLILRTEANEILQKLPAAGHKALHRV